MQNISTLPLDELFVLLTEQSFRDVGLDDAEVEVYVADLLTKITRTGNLFNYTPKGQRYQYVVDMLSYVSDNSFDPFILRVIRKDTGDYTLVILGLFPGSLSRGASHPVFGEPKSLSIGSEYYRQCGKVSYSEVASIDRSFHRPTAKLFEKLSDTFEGCVEALDVMRERYIQLGRYNDPIYRIMGKLGQL